MKFCRLKQDRFITGKISYDVRTYPETYSEPCITSKMEHFAKIVNVFKLLTIFRKYSILPS